VRDVFLSARRADASSAAADVVIAGFPVDDSVSFRSGAASGPAGIRTFSDSIESFSPRLGRDLEDLDIVDVGDPSDAEAFVAGAWAEGARPLLVSLGGDHSITPPLVASVARRCPGLSVVGFDAHLDLRATYPGEHACTFRRITDAGVACSVVGVRSGSREEWADARGLLRDHPRSLDVTDPDGPVYVTVDIDVLDPSVAPGVGNPEPDGPRLGELLDALSTISQVVAFDVVEVAPPLDPSGVTQVSAAVLVREMILGFGG